MIALGIYDSDVDESAIAEYLRRADKLTNVSDLDQFKSQLRGDQDDEWVKRRMVGGLPSNCRQELHQSPGWND